MKCVYLAPLFIFISTSAFAWEVGVGLYRKNETVQTQSGSEQTAPLNLELAIGHTFNLTPSMVFSPYFGYIKHNKVSDDTYGKYDVTTWALIYDFLWTPQMSISSGYTLRYGIGTFIKRYEGQGGTVEVPNGASVDTAYIPKKSNSYTMSLNFGGEMFFGPVLDYFMASGIRAELFMFHPIDGQRRAMSLNLMWIGYFQ